MPAQQRIYNGPYYRYDLPLLQKTIEASKEASDKYGCKLFYALKANNEERIVAEIIERNVGVDCVSGGEINYALERGWNASQVVFAGSGKTIREIEFALSQNISVIHCESRVEFDIIKEIKGQLNSVTEIALRINPDLKVNTHEKISTGEKHHKFGMSFQDALAIINANANDVCGFHFHVGSQITDMVYFEDLSLTVRGLLEQLPNHFSLQYLNLGGGLGIDYTNPQKNTLPNFEGWMNALRKFLPTDVVKTINLEPGRSIVGQCGQLIGEVQYIKHEESNPTAILDVGMTELLRPALYDARHKITVNKDELIVENYTVSGPTCESSDTFGCNHALPPLERGDLLIIHSAGAYGSSMRLNYNLRDVIPSEYIQETVRTHFKQKVA
ncbi:MAG: diaminopimelate decarboxylase [Brumimicrobium sp.]